MSFKCTLLRVRNSVRGTAIHGIQPGDPKRAVDVIIDVVKDEGVVQGKKMPGDLILGSDAFGAVGGTLAATGDMMDNWRDIILSTDFPKET